MALTEAQKYLATSKGSNKKQKVLVEIDGKKIPFTIRPLTNKEYNEAVQKTINIANKNVTVNEDDGNSFICVNCIVDPDFRDQEWIDYVNTEIRRNNAEEKKRVEESYLKAVEKFTKEKEKDENAEPPKKEKPNLEKEVLTSYDLLKLKLMPGTISELSDKIQSISGFGNKIQDYVEDVKKN